MAATGGFAPASLAKELSDFVAVNVGAAGTLVIRRPGSRPEFRAELVRKLPFQAVAGDSQSLSKAFDQQKLMVVDRFKFCECGIGTVLRHKPEQFVPQYGGYCAYAVS